MERRGHKRKSLENIVEERLKRIRNEMFLIDVESDSEESAVEDSDQEIDEDDLDYEDDMVVSNSEESDNAEVICEKTNNFENIEKDKDEKKISIDPNFVIKEEATDVKIVERTIAATGEHMYCPIVITEYDPLDIDEDGIEMVHVAYQPPEIVNLESSDESDKEGSVIFVKQEPSDESDGQATDETDDGTCNIADNSRKEAAPNTEGRIRSEQTKFELETENVAHHKSKHENEDSNEESDNTCEQRGKPVGDLANNRSDFDNNACVKTVPLDKMEIDFGDLNSKLKIPEPLSILGCKIDIQDEYMEQVRGTVARSVLSECESYHDGNEKCASVSKIGISGNYSPKPDIQRYVESKAIIEKKNDNMDLQKQDINQNIKDHGDEKYEFKISKTDSKLYTNHTDAVKLNSKVDEKGDSISNVVKTDVDYIDDTYLRKAVEKVQDESRCLLSKDVTLPSGGNRFSSFGSEHITENNLLRCDKQVGSSDTAKDIDIDSTILSIAEGETFKYLEETFIVLSSSESELEELDNFICKNKNIQKHNMKLLEVSDMDHLDENKPTIKEKDKDSVIHIELSQDDSSYTSSTINGSLIIVDEDTCSDSEIEEIAKSDIEEVCNSPDILSGKGVNSQKYQKFETDIQTLNMNKDYSNEACSMTEANANLKSTDNTLEFSDTHDSVSEQNSHSSVEMSDSDKDSHASSVSDDHDTDERNTSSYQSSDVETEQANAVDLHTSVYQSDESVIERNDSESSKGSEKSDDLKGEQSVDTNTSVPVTVSIVIDGLDDKLDKTDANEKDMRSLTNEKGKTTGTSGVSYESLNKENEVIITMEISNTENESTNIDSHDKNMPQNNKKTSVVDYENEDFEDRYDVSELDVCDQSDANSPFDGNNNEESPFHENDDSEKLDERMSDKEDNEVLDSEDDYENEDFEDRYDVSELDVCDQNDANSPFHGNNNEESPFHENDDSEKLDERMSDKEDNEVLDSEVNMKGRNVDKTPGDISGNKTDNDKEYLEYGAEFDSEHILQIDPLEEIDNAFESPFESPKSTASRKESTVLKLPPVSGKSKNILKPGNSLRNTCTKPHLLYSPIKYFSSESSDDELKESFGCAYQRKDAYEENFHCNENDGYFQDGYKNGGESDTLEDAKPSVWERLDLPKKLPVWERLKPSSSFTLAVTFNPSDSETNEVESIDHQHASKTSPVKRVVVMKPKSLPERADFEKTNEATIYSDDLESREQHLKDVMEEPFAGSPLEKLKTASVLQSKGKAILSARNNSPLATGTTPLKELQLYNSKFEPITSFGIPSFETSVNSNQQLTNYEKCVSPPASQPVGTAEMLTNPVSPAGFMLKSFRHNLPQLHGGNTEQSHFTYTPGKPIPMRAHHSGAYRASKVPSVSFGQTLAQTNLQRVIPQKLDIEPQKTDVIQQKIDVIQQKPDVIQQKTDVIQQKTDVIQQKTDVIQQKPDVIPQKTDVIPQKKTKIIPLKTENIVGEFIPGKVPLDEKIKWHSFFKCDQCGHECKREETMNAHFKCTMHRCASRYNLKYADNFAKQENYLINKTRPFDELVHVCPFSACEKVFLTRAECILHYQRDHGKLDRVYCTAKIQKEELCRIRCFCSMLECNVCGKLLADGLNLEHHSQNRVHPLYNQYEGTFHIFVCYGCQEFYRSFVPAVDHKCLKKNPSNIALRLLHVSKNMQKVHIE